MRNVLATFLSIVHHLVTLSPNGTRKKSKGSETINNQSFHDLQKSNNQWGKIKVRQVFVHRFARMCEETFRPGMCSKSETDIQQNLTDLDLLDILLGPRLSHSCDGAQNFPGTFASAGKSFQRSLGRERASSCSSLITDDRHAVLERWEPGELLDRSTGFWDSDCGAETVSEPGTPSKAQVLAIFIMYVWYYLYTMYIYYYLYIMYIFLLFMYYVYLLLFLYICTIISFYRDHGACVYPSSS
jgi:hypothetical protein